MRSMGILLVAAVGIMLSNAGSAQDKKAVDNDNKRIDGTWNIVSAESPPPTGKKTNEELAKLKIIFKDGSIIMMGGDQEEKYAFKLDPSKKPKQIDMTAKSRMGLFGIYELDGDNLKLCLTEGKDTPRPTKFAAAEEAMLLILQRQK